jgi:hypothetical protein
MSVLGCTIYSSYTQDSVTRVPGLSAVRYVNTWVYGINGQLKMKFVSHIT